VECSKCNGLMLCAPWKLHPNDSPCTIEYLCMRCGALIWVGVPAGWDSSQPRKRKVRAKVQHLTLSEAMLDKESG